MRFTFYVLTVVGLSTGGAGLILMLQVAALNDFQLAAPEIANSVVVVALLGAILVVPTVLLYGLAFAILFLLVRRLRAGAFIAGFCAGAVTVVVYVFISAVVNSASHVTYMQTQALDVVIDVIAAAAIVLWCGGVGHFMRRMLIPTGGAVVRAAVSDGTVMEQG